MEWTQISTALEVNNANDYYPAEDALKNAATPTDTSAPLTIEWDSKNSYDQYYYYPHFAEIQDFQANETTEFSVIWNGEQQYGPFTPNRSLLTVFSTKPQTSDGGRCSFQLIRTNR
ncbi:hypothetical protein Bca52824_036228 [Brassica carinata]|uniref:Malectin-like domain-containing protein n=1 Tax=Brassica carinata TaxID=52824 RepID=A0A8X7S537_BRACI|nr:hypothetical protein Bca52824_036228 [Brassica carinata]